MNDEYPPIMMRYIALENVWSWRKQFIKWDKFNLIIGPNSSGKSNLIQAIAIANRQARVSGGGTNSTGIFPFKKHEDQISTVSYLIQQLDETFIHMYSNFLQIENNNCRKNPYYKAFNDNEKLISLIDNLVNNNSLNTIGTNYQTFYNRCLKTLNRYQASNRNSTTITTQTVIISSIRKISEENTGDFVNVFDTNDQLGFEFQGGSVKRLLHNLKNATSTTKQKRFEKLKTTFENLSFIHGDLIISSETGLSVDIYIDYGDYQVKIEDEGAGIQDTLIIMTALEIHRGNIILIEEPETHLHPSAQRELFNVIKSYNNESQIFITTHSTVFANLVEPSQIYLVDQDENGYSTLNNIQNEDQFSTIKSSLGIQNSDALFSNHIVIVEGLIDELVFTELLKVYANLSSIDIRFTGTKGETKAGNVFASNQLVKLPLMSVILDEDNKGSRNLNKFWEKVQSICNYKTDELKEIKKSTAILLIKPNIEVILIGNVKALSRYFEIPEEDIIEKLNGNKIVNPKDKIKKLISDLNPDDDEITYNSEMARKIASKFEKDEIPDDVASFFDGLIDKINRK